MDAHPGGCARGEVGRSCGGRPTAPREGAIGSGLAFLGIAFLGSISRGPIQADFLYLYAASQYNLSLRTTGILATTAAVISLPILLLAGWVMDRFGRKRTMVPGFAGVTFTMVALAATPILRVPETLEPQERAAERYSGEGRAEPSGGPVSP
ncbi:MAG TPA: MFS transporter [Dehalococcoidia bacterium]|nr:MFS transporter [Dehalococcoidia bacterium]